MCGRIRKSHSDTLSEGRVILDASEVSQKMRTYFVPSEFLIMAAAEMNISSLFNDSVLTVEVV
jgi:hypothetical protein